MVSSVDRKLVDNPAHYGGDQIYEVIKILEATMNADEFRGFCRGNAIKYRLRAGKKPGQAGAQDRAKATWYEAYLEAFEKRVDYVGDSGVPTIEVLLEEKGLLNGKPVRVHDKPERLVDADKAEREIAQRRQALLTGRGIPVTKPNGEEVTIPVTNGSTQHDPLGR